jgi:hypothetical protein
VLLEVKRYLNDEVSLFSGINFDVDKDRDLNGFCDYILSRSPEQFYTVLSQAAAHGNFLNTEKAQPA